jgi:hypothetical protein
MIGYRAGLQGNGPCKLPGPAAGLHCILQCLAPRDGRWSHPRTGSFPLHPLQYFGRNAAWISRATAISVSSNPVGSRVGAKHVMVEPPGAAEPHRPAGPLDCALAHPTIRRHGITLWLPGMGSSQSACQKIRSRGLALTVGERRGRGSFAQEAVSEPSAYAVPLRVTPKRAGGDAQFGGGSYLMFLRILLDEGGTRQHPAEGR